MSSPTPARSAGILLHPTSLPGPFGIGDLGDEAYRWVDALVRARQSWWQILPLTPTGYGDSPYSAFSAFAGNPLLVSPGHLLQDGLLTREDLDDPDFPPDHVDFGGVIFYKGTLLEAAWQNFHIGGAPGLRGPFEAFCREQASWLDDFALFMAIKQRQDGKSWQEWPDDLRLRKPDALAWAEKELSADIGSHRFRQFLFFRQWLSLRRYAHDRGIKLIGDVPIFVAGDSADVWANPQMFLLDEKRRAKVVAGVPPDYFSATGQLWGNPQYDWPALKATGYAWWIARVRATLAQVDVIRLDHFLGFNSSWHISADATTAQVGKWVTGPGADLFETLRRELGGLPFIAEDLGIVTPEVEVLRDRFDLPGMLILQFAFGGATENRFLPHNFVQNAVVYTGTHDNDTTRGWYGAITEQERHFVRRYLGRNGDDIAWDMIRMAWASVARYAVTTLQDLFDLGTEARMNLPGTTGSNWGWRFRREHLTDELLGRLAELTVLYSREPEVRK